MLQRIKPFDRLTEEMLANIPVEIWKSSMTTFLDPCIGGGQFVSAIVNKLRIYGHSDENISCRVFGFENNSFLINYAINEYNLIGQYSVRSYDEIINGEYDMKFDVIVGNPPFSSTAKDKIAGKGGKKLYDKFFKKSLELAPIVIMVLPTTNKKQDKKHNSLLKEKANIIEFISDDVFDVVMPMWYVIVDGSDRTPGVEFNISNIVSNKIDWTKGKVNMTAYKNLTAGHGNETFDSENTITIYHKVNSKELSKRYGKPEHFKINQFFPDNGYAVLMPQTITDNGWARTEIVKCTGAEVAFHGMNIVFTKTKKQAKRLIAIMNTQSFKQQANNVKQNFNQMNASALREIKIEDDVIDEIFI